MRQVVLAGFAALGGCAAEVDTLAIHGVVPDWDVIHVVAVTTAEWAGDVPNGTGPIFDVDTTDGTFAFDVPPGSWHLQASAGTCGAGEDVEGEAGETVEVTLDVGCWE